MENLTETMRSYMNMIVESFLPAEITSKLDSRGKSTLEQIFRPNPKNRHAPVAMADDTMKIVATKNVDDGESLVNFLTQYVDNSNGRIQIAIVQSNGETIFSVPLEQKYGKTDVTVSRLETMLSRFYLFHDIGQISDDEWNEIFKRLKYTDNTKTFRAKLDRGNLTAIIIDASANTKHDDRLAARKGATAMMSDEEYKEFQAGFKSELLKNLRRSNARLVNLNDENEVKAALESELQDFNFNGVRFSKQRIVADRNDPSTLVAKYRADVEGEWSAAYADVFFKQDDNGSVKPVKVRFQQRNILNKELSTPTSGSIEF